MRDGAAGAERGDGEGHRHPVIALRIGDAAGRRARAVHDEAIGVLVGVDAERPEAGDQRGDAVALLDAELGGAAHARPRRHAPPARQSPAARR